MTTTGAAGPALPSMPVLARAGIEDRHYWRRTAGVTFGLGVVLFLYHAILSIGFENWHLAPPNEQLRWFVVDQIRVFALMAAVTVADRATGKDPDRRAPYVWAVVLGAAAGAILISIALQLDWNIFAWEYGPVEWSKAERRVVTFRVGFTLYCFFETLALGGAAVYILLDRRRARVARTRMHAAELARANTARRMLESQLQALQARVEPQFLFNTLAQVKQLYGLDPARGDRMLDDLIVYLRTAMPKMRDTSSSLGEEAQLARAYLDIVKLRLDDRLAVEVDVPSDLADARFPPMLLLPLIDHALAHKLDPRLQKAASLRISATARDGRLELGVADAGSGFTQESGAGIASIHQRLEALYGEAARLSLRATEQGGSEALIEIPREMALVS